MSSDRSAAEPAGFSFDRQAAGFDRRAGIPAAASERIAAAVEALGTGVILDVGAGTGEIGSYLARGKRPYIGLDLSLPMLAVYRRKLDGDTGHDVDACVPPGRLAQADAATRWPIADAAVGTLFMSRAAHLLDPAHLVAESMRVAQPSGAILIVGRVRRGRSSLRAEMRRRLHRFLAEQGVEGRGGERSRKRLAAAFEARAARVSPPREVAIWPVVERPIDSLTAWHDKPGLAGRALGPELRRDVLRRLEGWARERFGDLETAHEAQERYELTVARCSRSSGD